MLSWWKDIYYVYKMKEVVLWEELSLLLEAVHYRARGACPPGLKMSDRYVRSLAQQAISNGGLISALLSAL